MSFFNFGKPKWYKQLPNYFQLSDSKVLEIENFRIRFGIDDNPFEMMISMTPWSISKLQLFMLEKIKRENPLLSQKDLWKAVIQSRMNVKIMTLDTPPPFFATPISREEINSIINNLESIVSNFKSFDELIKYLIEIDRKEGWFTDPSGLGDELNDLLENN